MLVVIEDHRQVNAKQFLTTGEVAKHCGVNFRTVIRWVDKGLLDAHKLPGRGDKRIPVDAFLKFLGENGLPIPEEYSQSSSSILIVDDDPSITLTIQHILERSGYETEVVNSGIEACFSIAEKAPLLITLDIEMPKFDGIQLLKLLKSKPEYSAIKTVILSGSSDETLALAQEEGADAILQKPINNELLVRTVTELLVKSST